MEFNPFPIALPAIIALGAKVAIFAYARHSRTHNLQTRLFLWALFALAIQNLAEIDMVYSLADGDLPATSFTLFYATSIVALALFLHLAVSFSIESAWPMIGRIAACVEYALAFVLLGLLLFTDTILQGVRPVDYTLTRIPGALYPLFEIYIVGTAISLLVLFSYGALRLPTAAGRAKNALVLAGMFPALAIIISVLTLLHFEVKWVNATAILPLAVTLFVAVSAYAIYQHRIFDIQIFIPWSKSRRRKTAFHSGVRRLIGEIAELPSANEIVERLSDTLRCPVALLGPNRSLFAGDAASQMANLAQADLSKVDQIVVAEEITESMPHMYAAMKSNKIAAIVPFYPNAESVSGWLLLGDSFKEQVHSPLDFRLVEELFGKMSELFLDRFVALRAQLLAANTQLQALTAQNEALQERLQALENEKRARHPDQPVDLYADYEGEMDHMLESLDPVLASPITFLGRDKEMIRALTDAFRGVKSFVGVGSAAFRRTDDKGLVVCHVPDAHPRLLRFLSARTFPCPAVIYGPGVDKMSESFHPQFGGGLVDVIYGNAGPALLCARVRALMQLQRYLYSRSYSEQPLLGRSPSFSSFVQQLEIFAGLKDPILLVYDDAELAQSAATYLHEYRDSGGRLIQGSVRTADQALTGSSNTVTLTELHLLTESEQDHIANLMQERSDDMAHLVITCPYDRVGQLNERIRILTQGFSVDVPALHERREDIPLLVHYYTLGFNLGCGTFRSLDKSEAHSLKLHEPGWTLRGLRQATRDFLANKTEQANEGDLDFSDPEGAGAIGQERSLEELISELEARIIKQSLQRCEGNKSKAARILGLRPNTLHYKLERYGISSPKRARRHKTN